MKEMLSKLNSTFKILGYKKDGNTFWKIDNGYYRLINFQKGQYNDYFFINIGINPVKFPKLISNKLEVPEKPKEYECIIRARIEQIITDNDLIDKFRKDFVYITDDEIIDELISIIPNDLEKWFKKMASDEYLLNMNIDAINLFISSPPITKTKSFLMLKYFCSVRLGYIELAKNLLNEYKHITINDYNFNLVDNYLISLLD